MKKHIVVSVVFLLFSSIACWANIAPEFRHPCHGQCCISGANPGTHTLCQENTVKCNSRCTVHCEDVSFLCGVYSYTRSVCQFTGRSQGEGCLEAEDCECDSVRDGYGNPCDQADCLVKAAQHIDCNLSSH